MALASSLTFRNEYAWLLIAVMVSGFVSLFLSLQLGFFLLLFLATAWWVWENPEEGFLLFLIIAPMLPMLKITQTIGTVTLIKDVIILTLFVRMFAWPLLNKRLPYRRNIFVIPILVLIGWTTIGVLMADVKLLGILRARDIVLYTLLYFGVLYLPHSTSIMRTRARWVIAGLIMIMLLAVYQWFAAVDSAVLRFDPIREIWIPRLSSVMAHPSIFGQYLVTAALLALAGIVRFRKERPVLIWSAIFAGALPLIFLTYSRGVWIGLAAGGTVIGMALAGQAIAQKARKSMVIKSALAIAIIIALSTTVLFKMTPALDYIRSAIDPSYGSNEERLEFVARLLGPLTNTEALFGKGLGDVIAQNFRETNLEVYDIAAGSARSVQLTKDRTLVDNQYLKTLVEAGLAGLLIYLLLYWVFLQASLQGITSDSRDSRMIGLWGVGFLAAFAIQGLFIDIWDIFPSNALFWIMAALVSVSAGGGRQLNPNNKIQITNQAQSPKD